MYAFEGDDPANGSDPMGLFWGEDTLLSGLGCLTGPGESAVMTVAAPVLRPIQDGKEIVDATRRTWSAYKQGGMAAAHRQMEVESRRQAERSKEQLLGMIPGVNTYRQGSKIAKTYEKEGPFAGGMQVGRTTFSLGSDVAVVYAGAEAVQAARAKGVAARSGGTPPPPEPPGLDWSGTDPKGLTRAQHVQQHGADIPSPPQSWCLLR